MHASLYEVEVKKLLTRVYIRESVDSLCRDGIASFPGPARLSLAVQNSRRGPGLVHHVMSATAYVTAGRYRDLYARHFTENQ